MHYTYFCMQLQIYNDLPIDYRFDDNRMSIVRTTVRSSHGR